MKIIIPNFLVKYAANYEKLQFMLGMFFSHTMYIPDRLQFILPSGVGHLYCSDVTNDKV